MTKKIFKFMLRTKQSLKNKGFLYTANLAFKTAFIFSYYKLFKSNSKFRFNNKSYNYFYHPYGVTWKNDRAIEIPIVWDIVQQSKGKKILEVGNVLSHYYNISHTVVDKYEKDDYEKNKVINQDITEYSPNEKFDLIVSISTLEHVGWDEPIKDENKTIVSIEKLKSLLNKNGKLVVTFPYAYNKFLSNHLKESRIKFDELYCLKKIARRTWEQTTWEVAKDIGYNSPYSNTNALIIGVINNSD